MLPPYKNSTTHSLRNVLLLKQKIPNSPMNILAAYDFSPMHAQSLQKCEKNGTKNLLFAEAKK